MGLNVVWTDFSKTNLKDIYSYYLQNASKKIAQKMFTGIIDKTRVLNDNPEIGQLEELLINEPENFRYLVFKYYKIIYWINREYNRVEIGTVFATRQNPIKLKKRI